MATKKSIKKTPKAKGKPAVKSASKKQVKSSVKKKASAPVKKAVKKTAVKSSAKKSAPKKAVKAIAKKQVKTSAKKAVKKTVAPASNKKVASSVKKVAATKNNNKSSVTKPAAKPVKAAAVKKNEVIKKVAAPVKPAVKAPLKKTERPVAQALPSVKTSPKQSVPVQPVQTTQQVKSPVKTKMSNVQNTPERSRYSDAELTEFKDLIIKKLDDARTELINLQAQIINANENGTDDTGATFKMLEDGSDTLAKEEAAQLAARQKKFIEQLEAALVRIENKTYGICRVTGKLIPKERLRAVPHTTQSMEAKLKQYRD